MDTKKWYRATDAVGRKWVVSREAILDDYIQFLMQVDGLEKEAAQRQADKEEFPEYWWYEQVVIYPDLVMKIGEMVKDIPDKDKQQVLERSARVYMESED